MATKRKPKNKAVFVGIPLKPLFPLYFLYRMPFYDSLDVHQKIQSKLDALESGKFYLVSNHIFY